MDKRTGILYVVATPIGNLEDLTFRALRILKEVDHVVCEDTRETSKLLQRYKVKKNLTSCHQHTDDRTIQRLIQELEQGKTIALVTDAGTPAISDPGGRFVRGAREKGISIVPIPGPSALTAALSIAGIPADSFLFLGFLPRKKRRRKLLESFRDIPYTIVIYESPHRIVRTLEELEPLLGKDQPVILARELTKKFEEIMVGNLGTLLDTLRLRNTKGEFVILLPHRSVRSDTEAPPQDAEVESLLLRRDPQSSLKS